MPIYTMQAPNGKTYEIEGPEGATAEDVRAEILRRDPSAGESTPQPAVEAPEEPSQSLLGQLGTASAKTAGNVVEGLGDVVGMVNDPFATALGRGLGYEGYTADTGRTVREAAGLPEDDTLSGTIQRGAAGGLGFSGAARAAGAGLTGIAKTAAGELAATPVLDTVSGALGAGASRAAEDAGAGPVVSTIAGLAAGLGPYAVGRSVRNVKTGVNEAGRPYQRYTTEEGLEAYRSVDDNGRPFESVKQEDGSETVSYLDLYEEPGLQGSVTSEQAAVPTPEVLPEGVPPQAALADAPAPLEEMSDEDLISRLSTTLKDASKLTEEQQRINRLERSQRFQAIRDIQKYTSGEQGFHDELGALKGAFEKVEFEAIRDQFSEPEVTRLFEMIKNNPNLSTPETIVARKGLEKLMEGKVPVNSELGQLAKVFPAEFIKDVMSKRTTFQAVKANASNIMNLPRAMMSTADLSAPFRQGVFMVGRKQFWKSLVPMVKQFASEDAHVALQQNIRSRPTYDLMKEHKLAIEETALDMSTREEAFQSNLAEKIPVFGRLARASNRAYSGFLHKLRADVFDDILSRNPEMVEDPYKVERLARYINAATGRGNLPEVLENAAPVLNAMMFSPRLMSSRLTLMNPQTYITEPPEIRREAIRDLIGFGATAATVLGLAEAAGLDVEINPLSSDFAKIRSGNRRYDILGGFQQYMKLGAVLATGEKKTLKGEIKELGEGYKTDTRFDTLLNFFRTKASPIAGYIFDALDGQNIIGEEFNLTKDTAELFIPMFLSDLVEAVGTEGLEGAAKTAPGFVGVGVQNFEPRNAFDAFGRSMSEPLGEDTPAIAEMKRLGISSPVQSVVRIDGERKELTKEEKDTYQELAGRWATEDVAADMQEPFWQELSDTEKAEAIKDIVSQAKKDARDELFSSVEEVE